VSFEFTLSPVLGRHSGRTANAKESNPKLRQERNNEAPLTRIPSRHSVAIGSYNEASAPAQPSDFRISIFGSKEVSRNDATTPCKNTSHHEKRRARSSRRTTSQLSVINPQRLNTGSTRKLGRTIIADWETALSTRRKPRQRSTAEMSPNCEGRGFSCSNRMSVVVSGCQWIQPDGAWLDLPHPPEAQPVKKIRRGPRGLCEFPFRSWIEQPNLPPRSSRGAVQPGAQPRVWPDAGEGPGKDSIAL
jgi:hypothetical protein